MRYAGKILDGELLSALDALDLYVHELKNGHFSGARRSRAYGSSPEFADYRDYVPGDDLRRIDWNLAGRFDRYFIKRFIDEKQGRNCIYLDQSASMGFEEEKGLKALQLAAALGYLSVSNMDCASYRLLSGGACLDLCGSIIGRESFYGAVQKLETIEFAGDADLHSAILSDPRPGFDDGVSYIISDFLTESDWKGALDHLLAHHRELAVIQVLSKEEMEPSIHGAHSLCDCEAASGCIHVLADRDALDAYSRALHDFLGDVRRFCASRGVPYMLLRSDERVEEALIGKGCMEELIR